MRVEGLLGLQRVEEVRWDGHQLRGRMRGCGPCYTQRQFGRHSGKGRGSWDEAALGEWPCAIQVAKVAPDSVLPGLLGPNWVQFWSRPFPV